MNEDLGRFVHGASPTHSHMSGATITHRRGPTQCLVPLPHDRDKRRNRTLPYVLGTHRSLVNCGNVKTSVRRG